MGEGRLAEVEQRQTEEDTLRAELKKQQTRLHHLNRDVITMVTPARGYKYMYMFPLPPH